MPDVTQRDREADFETLIASAYNTGYHDGGIDTLEDGHHPDSAAEGLAQWKADNAGLIEGTAPQMPPALPSWRGKWRGCGGSCIATVTALLWQCAIVLIGSSRSTMRWNG